MAKILIASSPFHGHVGPLSTVAQYLSKVGHQVSFWTGRAFGEQVGATGARFVPLPSAVDFDGRNMSRSFPELSKLKSGPPMHRFFWRRIFIDALADQHRGLAGLLDEFPADVVIHDPVFLGALPLAQQRPRRDRPLVVALGVLPPMLLSDHAVPFALGMTARDGRGDADRIRELNALARQTYSDVQAHAESAFASVGARLDEFIFSSTVTLPDHYLQLSVPGFEYPRQDWPASFRFIGALPLAPMARYQAPDWWAELSNSRGVVVVTQGTLANDDLTELIAPTLEAMADSDALVVAATARADGPDDLRRLLAPVPPNACIGGYVPFDRLLPFADVLVTNGGYGGVHTALQHGVPLVVAGESEDKLDVSARVDWSGVGVDLRTAQPDRRALRAAIELVMQRRSFTRRAARLRAELSRYRPLETIDRVIREETAAGRRNPESSYRADAG